MSIDFSAIRAVKDSAKDAVEVVKIDFELEYDVDVTTPLDKFKSKLNRMKDELESVTTLDVDFYNCVSIEDVKTLIHDPDFLPITFMNNKYALRHNEDDSYCAITGYTYCSFATWAKYTDNYAKLLLYMILSCFVDDSVDNIHLKQYNLVVGGKFRYSLFKE